MRASLAAAPFIAARRPPAAPTAQYGSGDAATGQERASLTGHTGTVTAVAAAPDGSWLATGSADGTVRSWRMTDGTPLVPPLTYLNRYGLLPYTAVSSSLRPGPDIAVLQLALPQPVR